MTGAADDSGAARQVIVVVHGVGVREAGAAGNLVAAALAGPADGVADAYRREASDDFYVAEHGAYSVRGMSSVFPARLIRFAPPAARPAAPERLIVDFYWGDITGTGMTLPRVVTGFFKLILGLSHAIRENAREVFHGERKGDRFWSRLAETAALTIHGPIFAINLVLLGGFLAWAVLGWITGRFGNGQALVSGDVAAVLIALAAIGGGLWCRRCVSYLERLLGFWLIVTGIVLILSAAISAYWPNGPLARFDAMSMQLNCGWAGDPAAIEACKEGFAGFFLHGLRLTSLMILCWFGVMVAGLLLGPACRKRLRGERERVRSFVMQALALMSALWIIVFAAVWGTVLKLVGAWGGAEAAGATAILVPSVLRALIPAIAVVLLVGIASGLVQLAKRARLRRLARPADYLDGADARAEDNRLIVSRAALVMLAFFFPAMLAVVLLSFAAAYPGLPGAGWAAGLSDAFRIRLAGATGATVGVMAVVAGVLVGALRGGLSRVIAIFTDILAYLNDRDWSPGLRGDNPAPAGMPSGYFLRDRIRDRLSVLVATLVRDERPGELVLLSHSQGTVIAIDVLRRDGPAWLRAMGAGGRIKLVTMGAPYTHLYNRYFPTSFPAHRQRAHLGPAAQGGVLSVWVNFLRVDDFVGTHVDAARNLPAGADPPLHFWPREIAVPARGHTGYWIDEDVAPHLAAFLAPEAEGSDRETRSAAAG